MRWMAGLGLIAWIALTGFAPPAHSDAEQVVVCGAYGSALGPLIRSPDYGRMARATMTADAAGKPKIIEIPGDQLIRGGQILAGRMDPARARQLQQEGAQLARRHFNAGNAVATGHFIFDCDKRMWAIEAQFRPPAGLGRPKP